MPEDNGPRLIGFLGLLLLIEAGLACWFVVTRVI